MKLTLCAGLVVGALASTCPFYDVPNWSEDRAIGESFTASAQVGMDDRYQGELDGYPSPGSIYHRGLHNKGWCLKATFQTLGNVNCGPNDCNIGVFAKEKSYDAIVRWSEGSQDIHADSGFDIRGMAIKLFGVDGVRADYKDGPAIPEEENANTQDFTFINGDTFPASAADFVELSGAALRGNKLAAASFAVRHPIEIYKTSKILYNGGQIKNNFDHEYWSGGLPYALGKDQAVRYMVKPCAGQYFPTGDGTNYIVKNMQAALAQNGGEVCMEFHLQFKSCGESIADADEAWTGPTYKVAKLTFQKSSNPNIKVSEGPGSVSSHRVSASDMVCENLLFNPWHALADHTPLGQINRVRKEAMYFTQNYRRQKNAAHGYPTSTDPDECC